MILKSAGTEDDTREFIRLVYDIQEVQKRTGLSFDALDHRAHELERKATDLEPMSEKLKGCKKELAELTRQQEELTSVVAVLEQKHGLLMPLVRDLEKREHTLSSRITAMEPKAQKAEIALSTLNSEMQKLNEIGLSLKELAEFNGKVQTIAQHHVIEPAKLKARLLRELETLDKGLGLEALIQRRQQELQGMEQDITSTKKDMKATKTAIGSLKQEKTNLEAGIRESRETVSREIIKIIPLARDTIDRLGKELQRGNEEALTEVRRLRDEVLEVGKEVGRYEEILQANTWLSDLPALIRGEEGIAGKRVRAIALPVLRGIAIWLKRRNDYSLGLTIDMLIKGLEEWKV